MKLSRRPWYLGCVVLFSGHAAFGQVARAVPEAMPFDIPYGAPIRLERAKAVAAAAEMEAKRHNWKMACAVVEPTGDMVYFEKIDNTLYGSTAIAQEKARTAALFRRPTKVFQDRINASQPAYLSFTGVSAIEGGVPLVDHGQIIGAIGCSGGSSDQDGVVAKAGAESLQ